MIKIRGIDSTMKSARNKLAKEVELERTKIVEGLKNELVMATPVDTGNARAGWQIVNGNIINDVEYISDLNNGHSPQAPERFIERVVLSNPRVRANGIIVTDK